MTLAEFLADCHKATIWYTSAGSPTGEIEFIAPGYRDSISECDDWEDLTGTVTNEVWEWDGGGNPRDCFGNSVWEIVCRSNPSKWDRLKEEYDSEM